MKLINLLTKLKRKEAAKLEYFLAIELTDDIVKSAVWTVVDGHTKIVKIGPANIWDGQNQEKLLTAVDESISVAEQNLKPEPSGVIFGLPDSWVDKDSINIEKKAYLKFVCDSLALKPLGFVVSNTAVIQYLKIEEGSPASAIFLQLNSTEINLSLVKLGKLVGNEVVGRSDDLGADVEEGLARFKNIDTLPSRMILYDGKSDFEEDKQQLISYDWEEKLPFIHFPKVEVLPIEASIMAVSLAGGSEVAQSLGFEIKPQESTKEEKPMSKEKVITEDRLGFAAEDAALAVELVTVTEPEIESKIEPEETSEPIRTKLPALQLMKDRFSGIKLPKVILPRLSLSIIGFIVLIGLVFSAYWFLPKAKITLYFDQTSIEQSFNITIDPTVKTFDSIKTILPGEMVEISAEGGQSIATTGTKLVGEAAAGDAVIYNKTNQVKTFTQGTILIGPGNLAFSLDENTTVASASSSVDQNENTITSPGKANAKITAKSIGTESNLAADSKLSFKQFSDADYYVKTSGLSGGTSREARAVAQKDLDELLTKLTADLVDKAQADLQTKLGTDKRSVEIKDKDKLTSKSFNHTLNEEADNLTLTAKLNYTTLSYNYSELQQLSNAAIREKIPADFQLTESSEINLTAAKLAANNMATATVDFKAKLVPKLNFDEIKAKIKGRYPQATQEYLASLPNFLSAEIVIKPNFLKTLPRISKNITLEIKSP